ncbi:unnamed protein product [Strongylus vulgaris]|uniref:Uncharacterized protein n=1 Tax=Strongylus vulgaris TaxID=40348 RepID=A0A3P7IEE3_STRVU|nr:unnamed protein product [Strongylus vulgaris]
MASTVTVDMCNLPKLRSTHILPAKPLNILKVATIPAKLHSGLSRHIHNSREIKLVHLDQTQIQRLVINTGRKINMDIVSNTMLLHSILRASLDTLARPKLVAYLPKIQKKITNGFAQKSHF